MAEQTVPQQSEHYGYANALDNLRQTAQAAAIVRAVCLAVVAQEDGVVNYDDNKPCRWATSIDAAVWRMHKVRDSYMETINSPASVDWCTPLNLLEAMGAALWHLDIGTNKYAMNHDEVMNLCEAVLETLSTLHDDLSATAKELQGGAA